MTTEFSITRVKNLIVRQFIMGKKFLTAFVLGGGTGLCVATTFSRGLTIFSFWLIFSILFVIFTGTFPFSNYKNKRNRVLQITLPATQFEKYLSNFSFAFIISPIIIFIVCYASIFLGNCLSKIMFDPTVVIPFDSKEIWKYSHSILSICNLSNILYLATMFFGAIYFKKQRIIKTNVFLFAYAAILITASMIIFFDGTQKGYISFHLDWLIYNLSEATVKIGLIIATVFVLWLTYQRLKEERV